MENDGVPADGSGINFIDAQFIGAGVIELTTWGQASGSPTHYSHFGRVHWMHRCKRCLVCIYCSISSGKSP